MGELLKTVQNSDQFLSKPFSIFDKNSNGSTAQNGNAGYSSASPQTPVPSPSQIPGVSRFEEMDDGELPF